MTRAFIPPPDGADWVGHRVAYTPRHKDIPEYGVVTRMCRAKALAMFVQLDGHTEPKLCYAHDLERIEE